MKKILSILFLSSVYSLGSMAQTAETAKPEITKEQKAAMKKQKEELMLEAFTKAGLTPQQIERAKIVIENANTKNKGIKNDATLSEEQKKARLDESKEEQKRLLAEAMGADKYKEYTKIKKEQKAAAAEGKAE